MILDADVMAMLGDKAQDWQLKNSSAVWQNIITVLFHSR